MGKAMLLQAAGPTAWGAWVVTVVLASSLLLMVALARSGSVLFWSPAPTTPAAQGAMALATGTASDALPTAASHRWALGLLLAAVLACSAAAGPLSSYCAATAAQLFERQTYLRAVFDAEPAPAAIDVRREMREREARP
jgi:multicomponent K+:H+ antiporter subunit D